MNYIIKIIFGIFIICICLFLITIYNTRNDNVSVSDDEYEEFIKYLEEYNRNKYGEA